MGPTASERRELQAKVDDLWDFEDPKASVPRLRAAASSAASAYVRDVWLTQVARALGLQRRFDEALEILGAPPTDDPEVAVRRRLERGRVFNTRGDGAAAARPEFEAAHDLASRNGLEHLAVDALHMIAIVVPSDEQGEWHDRAIAAAEAATDPRARQWLASLYNNAGWTRFDLGHPDEALRLFEMALAERLRIGKEREIVIARWTVGRALRALGRIDEAFAIQQDLVPSAAGGGADDPYVEEELAECLLALGRAAEAGPHFAAAAAALGADESFVANEPERLARLRDLAALA
jgi:tetratricopeptide (TPR) repeat protein